MGKFKSVNGVKIREYEESRQEKSLKNKVFEIQYNDCEYLQQKVFLDLAQVSTSSGRKWMFVVKNENFFDQRETFTEVIRTIHDKLYHYLMNEIKLAADTILIDHKKQLN